MSLKIVFGSPCCGKTTYVKENKKSDDIVIDLDYIKHSLTYNSYHEEIEPHILSKSIELKKYILENPSDIGDIWLITTNKDEDTQNFSEDEKEFILINRTKEEVYNFIDNDDSRTDKDFWKELVDNWFDENEIIDNKFKKVVNQMSKVLKLKNIDYKTGEIKNSGSLEIKNQSEDSADLFFYGDIVSDSWMSEWSEDDMCPTDVKKFLDELENTKNINIHINSGGGSVFGGLAIYNQLKRYDATITTYIDGLAASIASVIAMAGDKVIMPENALLMIHKPLTWCYGNADDLQKQIDILNTCQKSILNIYMNKARPGVTEDEINKLINESTWMTGEEASNYFNIELEGSINVTNCTSNYFDKYNIPENKVVKFDEKSNTAFFNTTNKSNKIKNNLSLMNEATKIQLQRIKNL